MFFVVLPFSWLYLLAVGVYLYTSDAQLAPPFYTVTFSFPIEKKKEMTLISCVIVIYSPKAQLYKSEN